MHIVLRSETDDSDIPCLYYLLRLIPGLFPLYWFRVLSKYLQTQNILAPSVFIGLFAVGKQALFSWTLVFKSGWGIAGAPW
jgi:Na+-driven multidrug efflux pump